MSLDNANAEKIIKRIAKEIGIDKTNLWLYIYTYEYIILTKV
jgi:thermostable 8-oxoguanine DNA glycosylase